MDTRESILEAAVRAYERSGARGATTREIAEGAGVNEVTIFRQFGSKRALLEEALAWAARNVRIERLPREPSNPASEIAAWCRDELGALYGVSPLLRRSMADYDAKPDVTEPACEVPARVARELRTYLERLSDGGWIRDGINLDAATRMLVGGMFSEAITRDIMPTRFPDSVEESAAKYARLFAQVLGLDGGRRVRDARRAGEVA